MGRHDDEVVDELDEEDEEVEEEDEELEEEERELHEDEREVDEDEIEVDEEDREVDEKEFVEEEGGGESFLIRNLRACSAKGVYVYGALSYRGRRQGGVIGLTSAWHVYSIQLSKSRQSFSISLSLSVNLFVSVSESKDVGERHSFRSVM